MSDKDDIKELMAWKAKSEHDAEVKKDADIIVKARCAIVYTWIGLCLTVVGGILTVYSSTVKAIMKAAIKIIIARIWE